MSRREEPRHIYETRCQRCDETIEVGRDAVLVEIAEHYVPLIRQRCGLGVAG